MKATLKQMATLRRIGLMVDALSLQSRAYHRAVETGREFRQRLQRRVGKFERDLDKNRLVELARRFPAEHGPRLATALAEIDSVTAQIAESKAEEDAIRERWRELGEFSGSNAARLDEALETLRLSRSDLGIPWGERAEQTTQVDA